MANTIKGRNEEVDIYDLDPGYNVDISYDFAGLPENYGIKKVIWIFRFDVKARDPEKKPENNKYKLKLSKSIQGSVYVIYKEDKSFDVLTPEAEKGMEAGDPAIGIVR